MLWKRNETRERDLLDFGFGTELMKNSAVCTKCSSLEILGRRICSKCGARLPKNNLYDIYRSLHRSCRRCGTVLSARMRYCPRCGIRIRSNGI